METKINNSVVANNNSTISNSTIKSTDEEIKLPWWQNKVIVAKCILGFFVLVIIVMIANQILQ